jgi:hypothetical protein
MERHKDARKGGASIQASFRAPNLASKGFLKKPTTVLEGFASQRHLGYRKEVLMIRRLEV